MKIIEISGFIAISFLFTLFILAIEVKNPEHELYTKTTEMLMRQKGLDSIQELKTCFPKLIDIQGKLNRIDELSQLIQRKTQGPSPSISKEEFQQLENFEKIIDQTRKEVRTELIQLLVTHGNSNP